MADMAASDIAAWVGAASGVGALVVSAFALSITRAAERRAREKYVRDLAEAVGVGIWIDRLGDEGWVLHVLNRSSHQVRELVALPYVSSGESRLHWAHPHEELLIGPGKNLERAVIGLSREAGSATTAGVYAYLRSRSQHWRCANDAWTVLDETEGPKWRDALREMGRRVVSLDLAHVRDLQRQWQEAEQRRREVSEQLLAAVRDPANMESVNALNEARLQAAEKSAAAFEAWQEAVTRGLIDARGGLDGGSR